MSITGLVFKEQISVQCVPSVAYRVPVLTRARSQLARQLLSFVPSARVILQRYTFTTVSVVSSAPRSAAQPVAVSNTALRSVATSPSVSLGRVSCEVTVLACTSESSSSNPYGIECLCLANQLQHGTPDCALVRSVFGGHTASEVRFVVFAHSDLTLISLR